MKLNSEHFADQIQRNQRTGQDRQGHLEFFIINIPGVAIQQIDSDGTISFWNTVSEELYGYSSKYAVGKRFEDLLLDHHSCPEFNEALQKAWQNKKTSKKTSYLAKSSVKENLRVRGAFIPFSKNGVTQEVLAVQIDSTAHHKAETLLSQNKDDLKTHVKQNTEEFSQTTIKLHQEIITRERIKKNLFASNEKLAQAVKQRTVKLNEGKQTLDQQHQELIQYKDNLERLSEELLETNKAISVLAKNMERRKKEAIEKTTRIIFEKIMPEVDDLMQVESNHVKKSELDIIKAYLLQISVSAGNISKELITFSTSELKVAYMIKNGFTSSEIAHQHHVSLSTIKSHRKNIRRKLRINKTKINLENYLLSKL